MKKFLVTLLTISLVFVFATCGNNNKPDAEPEESADSGISTTVEQLYSDFDKAMEEQIGTLPDNYGDAKVGALIISTSNPFWANMETLYKEAGENLGITLDVQGASAEDDTQGQLDTLMTMADMDYDVIIVSPIDGTNLIPGIVKCNENGVKVINLGPGVDIDALAEAGGHLDAKITVNFPQQGKMCAEDMLKRIPDGGEVAIISGLAGAAQSEGRTAGAQESFESAENVDIVNIVNCDWDATKAYDATKDILAEHPDLKGIFACNDTMALACIEALESEGKDGVLVYGVDFTDDAKNAISEGKMTGTMSYSSAKYTEAALKMAILLNEGKIFEDPVFLPLTLANVDNVKDLEGWK